MISLLRKKVPKDFITFEELDARTLSGRIKRVQRFAKKYAVWAACGLFLGGIGIGWLASWDGGYSIAFVGFVMLLIWGANQESKQREKLARMPAKSSAPSLYTSAKRPTVPEQLPISLDVCRKPVGKAQYMEYLQSDHWKTTRRHALDRSGHRCQLCNGAGRLDVHHRRYDRLCNEKPGDLVVLCRACHQVFHSHRRVK